MDLHLDRRSLLFNIIILSVTSFVVAVPSVVVTAPVNPAREKGMISVHCHIKGLSGGHEVSMTRRLRGKDLRSGRLSWNDGIVSNVDDRFFIAERQLTDGSHVYFLSVTDVTRADEGIYTCSVFSGNTVVTEGQVEVNVQYYPSSSYPICIPSDVNNVIEGKPFMLNCTSEKGNPTVSVTWKRTREDSLKNADRVLHHVNETFVTSALTIVPALSDSGSVFLCTITHLAYQQNPTTCHVGPITVIPNRNGITTITESTVDHNQKVTQNIAVEEKDTRQDGDSSMVTNCRDVCSRNTTAFYWILATVTAVAISLIFLIIGIVLSIRMYKLNNSSKYADVRLATERMSRDDVYERLEYRQGIHGLSPDVYMTISKHNRQEIA